jgi:hypothetical protein
MLRLLKKVVMTRSRIVLGKMRKPTTDFRIDTILSRFNASQVRRSSENVYIAMFVFLFVEIFFRNIAILRFIQQYCELLPKAGILEAAARLVTPQRTTNSENVA